MVCKSCGSEVSPYITECPYCGNRLRKRAPKLDRHGRVAEKPHRRPAPSLPRLRRGEIPGIRAESRPYATAALIIAGFAGCLAYRATLVGSIVAVKLWFVDSTHMWWRLLVAPFTYANTGYAFVTLGIIAIFGWLLERRHGPVLVLAMFAAGGIGGQAASISLVKGTEYIGANGAAIALLTAWAIPDLVRLYNREEIESDMLGVGVLAVTLGLMCLAAPEASPISLGVGLLAGLVIGYPLGRVHLHLHR